MNKKYFFILIPLLALLFSFERGAGNIVASQCTSAIVYAGGNFVQGHKLPASIIYLQTERPKQLKIKLRTKAWDDATDLAMPFIQVQEILFSYHSESVLAPYSFPFRPAHLSTNSLRGPPIGAVV